MIRRREPFLDWLRVTVIFSLIPIHAALTYCGLGFVYIYDPSILDSVLARVVTVETVPIGLSLFAAFMDNWFMYILFFISGLSMRYLILHRGVIGAIRDRLRKIVIPFAWAVPLFIIPCSWLRARAGGWYEGSLFRFYPRFFNAVFDSRPDANMDWGHLWFLVYLITFFCLSLPLFAAFRKKKTPSWKGWYGVVFVVILALLDGGLRPRWPGYQNLIDDWANFLEYLFVFIFGYFFGTRRSFQKHTERRWPLYLIASSILYSLRLLLIITRGYICNYEFLSVLQFVLRGACSGLFVLAIFGFYRRFLNRDSRAHYWIQGFSFYCYLSHFLPVSVMAYLLLGKDWNYNLEWLIISFSAMAVVVLSYEILRRIPIIRNIIFALKPLKKGL